MSECVRDCVCERAKAKESECERVCVCALASVEAAKEAYILSMLAWQILSEMQIKYILLFYQYLLISLVS